MDKKYAYLDELNSNIISYSVKVKILEKARPRPSSKKGILYQSLLLTDDKGNKMRGALFGEQVEAFKDVIMYNGEYVISNAPVKLIAEQWRNNSGELPYQMYFGGRTVVQPVNSETATAGPIFQSIHTIPRIMISDTKYDVVGIVLYVEDKLRIINPSQGREFQAREIVITDHTNTQPLTITAWNDLAGIACDALSASIANFTVVGFTALRPSLHKGFSLSTGMSTQIIHDPKGEKADILREWAKCHTQQLLDKMDKILHVRHQTTTDIAINIQNLREKKAYNVIQEERHWLNVVISEPDLDNVITYIGCLNCGRRSNVPVGISFNCASCKKDNISSYRVTFKFEAVDDSGTMAFTTFTSDTEKLFGKTAQEIHAIRDSGDAKNFIPIQHRLRTSHISVQVGPTTALSRNNVLEWCLKGIEINTKGTEYHKPTSALSHKSPTSVLLPTVNEDPKYDTIENYEVINSATNTLRIGATNESTFAVDDLYVQKNFKLTGNLNNVDYIVGAAQSDADKGKSNPASGHAIESELFMNSSLPPWKKPCTEEQKTKAYHDEQHCSVVTSDVVSKTQCSHIIHPTIDARIISEIPSVSGTRGARKKRSLNALITGSEILGSENQHNSEVEYQEVASKGGDASALKESTNYTDTPTKKL